MGDKHDERAREIVERFVDESDGDPDCIPDWTAAIAQALREATMAERARCAAVALNVGRWAERAPGKLVQLDRDTTSTHKGED